MAGRGKARPGEAWQGRARQGTAGRGEAGRGEASRAVMDNAVFLISEQQVDAARMGMELVRGFIETHTEDQVADPDYAYARARALETLSTLVENWRHLPTMGAK